MRDGISACPQLEFEAIRDVASWFRVNGCGADDRRTRDLRTGRSA